MKTKPIPTFREVATNYDGDLAEEFFLQEGRRMILEGKKPDRIKMAMMQAGFRLAAEHGTGYGGFLIDLQRCIRKKIDQHGDKLVKEIVDEDRLKGLN